jgi:hypothetical protein
MHADNFNESVINVMVKSLVWWVSRIRDISFIVFLCSMTKHSNCSAF